MHINQVWLVINHVFVRHVHYIGEYTAGGKRLRSTDTIFSDVSLPSDRGSQQVCCTFSPKTL